MVSISNVEKHDTGWYVYVNWGLVSEMKIQESSVKTVGFSAVL